jgi:hypothetical protein
MIRDLRVACLAAGFSLISVSLGFAGTASITTFSEYTALSSNNEIARRMLSPLSAAKIPELLSRSGKELRGQPIVLADEKFALYVPPEMPPNGYGLLVFIPPWNDVRLPPGWDAALDKSGVIFVAPVNSGNDASVLGRRVPLAILGEYNVARRYQIDPARIEIAGFSGGSKVAMRLALAYPDIFTGALLNAGSVEIGNLEAPLPPADLFAQFQMHTLVVYSTGRSDPDNIRLDAASQDSLRKWCVFGVDDDEVTSRGHEVADAAAVSRAFEVFQRFRGPDAKRIEECRSNVDADLAKRFESIERLISAGRRDEARQALIEVDATYGGLAAPRSVELMQSLGAN